MRKLFITIAALLLTVATFSQTVGTIQTITADTLTAVETEYFAVQAMTGNYAELCIQALFTQLGGTSDGTAILQASVDGTVYSTIVDDDYDEIFFYGHDDTVTITNGTAWHIRIKDPAFTYYRIAATGTASDTTLVTVKYIIKR